MREVNIWSIEGLKRMDPFDFELLVGDLFEAMGYATAVTPRSRDSGVDILIKLEHFGLSHSWIVQAKKYEGNVGVREVREYGSLKMRDRVDGVIIVTTGNFTKDALLEAEQYNVKLISGDILVGMMNRYLKRPSAPKEEEAEESDDLLLHKSEDIILREQVFINGDKFEFILSNKNIFIKEIGFLSKRGTLKHKISILKIIGATEERNGILLFIGGENIKMCLLRGAGKILDVINQVKSSALGKSEKLIRYHRSGRRLMVLTDKRLFSRENETVWQVPLFRISGVETKSGWISGNSRIVLYVTGERTEQKDFAVEDAGSWKSEIETAVRSS